MYIGPYLVSNGLVVNLDTSNIKSYPGSGNIVFDISNTGTQCDASFSGGYTIDSTGITLDGINGNGFIPQPSITLGNGIDVFQQFSICFFIYPDNDSGWIISPQSAGSDHSISTSTASGGSLRFQVTESSDVNNRSLTSINGTIPVNKWTYVVCTLNNLTMNIYINGKFNVTRLNDTPITNWINSWRIGARATFSDFFFRGTLNNIQIYNRELTATEIKQNFNAFKGKYSNLKYID